MSRQSITGLNWVTVLPALLTFGPLTHVLLTCNWVITSFMSFDILLSVKQVDSFRLFRMSISGLLNVATASMHFPGKPKYVIYLLVDIKTIEHALEIGNALKYVWFIDWRFQLCKPHADQGVCRPRGERGFYHRGTKPVNRQIGWHTNITENITLSQSTYVDGNKREALTFTLSY